MIGASGKLTGYGGGLPNKEALLNLEARVLAERSPTTALLGEPMVRHVLPHAARGEVDA